MKAEIKRAVVLELDDEDLDSLQSLSRYTHANIELHPSLAIMDKNEFQKMKLFLVSIDELLEKMHYTIVRFCHE